MPQRNCVCMIVILFLILAPCSLIAQEPTPPAEQQRAEDQQTKTPPPVEPGQVTRPSETASTPSTIRRIATNFWSDQKAVWTSPLHINRENAKWWGVFAGTTAALIPVDERLSNSQANTSTQISFSKNVSQIGAVYTTLPLAGALYFYGRKKNDAKAREVGVLGAEALLDSAIIVQILKLGFGRERPDEPGSNGRFFKGKDSFPSGHAIETWAFASVISHEYAPSKIVPIVTYGLAAAVSASRMTGRRHYPSDILVGGTMGWFIGKYV